MKNVILVFSFLCSLSLSAQTISGIVTDANNNPIVQANVYLEGTYDGGTTNAKCEFSFKTEETGTQNLLVSFVGFETFTMLGDISYMKDLKIQLREDINALDTVILSAGTFSAGDNSKVNALKPLDVVTTASDQELQRLPKMVACLFVVVKQKKHKYLLMVSKYLRRIVRRRTIHQLADAIPRFCLMVLLFQLEDIRQNTDKHYLVFYY